MSKAKVLFILKYRDEPSKSYGISLSSGLYNSAQMICKMLTENGIPSQLIHVNIAEEIPTQLNRIEPRTVVVEDFWLAPDKLKNLAKQYPKINWIVRLHSELPTIATVGTTVESVLKYLDSDNVYVAANSERTVEDLQFITNRKSWKIIYLPNFYQLNPNRKVTKVDETIKIGCFGAVRPFKNHLEQAIAALRIGKELDVPMEFHVNATRMEQNGEPIMHNLRTLFHGRRDAKLVEHAWMSHEAFLRLCSQMDLGMQCNFSESFNIVSADMVNQWVPVVGSKAIPWLPIICKADPGDAYSMSECGTELLGMADWNLPQRWSLRNLRKHNRTAKSVWLSWVQ